MNGLWFGIALLVLAYAMTPRIDCALGDKYACERLSKYNEQALREKRQ